MKPFNLETTCGKARAGTLVTAHGEIKTPFFMPVATKGSVKLLSNEEVVSLGTQCLISNAFVLSLEPGLLAIDAAKGLHRFMGWDRPLFTDSGGFQVLSPVFNKGLTEKGVFFRNPFDGKKDLFTPEKSMEIQNRLGSDVAMCLDDVPTAGSSKERLAESAKRTTEWAKRCINAHENKKQLLFGICQGGNDKKLREKSAREIVGLGFDGHAVGGLSIGESKKEMFEMAEISLGFFPEEKPRYLMGVGSVKELVQAICLGVDVFDSAFPTRTARHGMAFGIDGNLNIESPKFARDFRPLDKDCECFVCKSHSRAFVHHLVKTKEENGLKYLSYHNLFFVQNVMKEMRTQIIEGTFSAEKFFGK